MRLSSIQSILNSIAKILIALRIRGPVNSSDDCRSLHFYFFKMSTHYSGSELTRNSSNDCYRICLLKYFAHELDLFYYDSHLFINLVSERVDYVLLRAASYVAPFDIIQRIFKIWYIKVKTLTMTTSFLCQCEFVWWISQMDFDALSIIGLKSNDKFTSFIDLLLLFLTDKYSFANSKLMDLTPEKSNTISS